LKQHFDIPNTLLPPVFLAAEHIYTWYACFRSKIH